MEESLVDSESGKLMLLRAFLKSSRISHCAWGDPWKKVVSGYSKPRRWCLLHNFKVSNLSISGFLYITCDKHIYIYIWLVASTPLKNMFVSWDYYTQLNGKIKFMFQATNQIYIYIIYIYIYIKHHWKRGLPTMMSLDMSEPGHLSRWISPISEVLPWKRKIRKLTMGIH